jgi:hypothetical protein
MHAQDEDGGGHDTLTNTLRGCYDGCIAFKNIFFFSVVERIPALKFGQIHLPQRSSVQLRLYVTWITS